MHTWVNASLFIHAVLYSTGGAGHYPPRDTFVALTLSLEIRLSGTGLDANGHMTLLCGAVRCHAALRPSTTALKCVAMAVTVEVCVNCTSLFQAPERGRLISISWVVFCTNDLPAERTFGRSLWWGPKGLTSLSRQSTPTNILLLSPAGLFIYHSIR